VATQYFGYLSTRRPISVGSFSGWATVNSAPLRDLSKQRAMVCSFITSAEYQQRFSAIVTHTNQECSRADLRSETMNSWLSEMFVF